MITKRIDAVTRVGEDRQKAVLSPPRSVKIELTARCNFKCGFCAHARRTNKKGEMSRDFFDRIVLELVAAGVEELGLFYIGESFLCDWLPDAISYAKSAGIKYTFLTTNGGRAKPDRVRAVMHAGLDSLKWSFNNDGPEQFEKVAGVPGRGFEILIRNMQSAWEIRQAEGFHTKLYASSIKYDGEQGERMKAAIARILPFVDEHYFLPLYSFGDQATKKEGELGYKPMPGNPGRVGALRDPLPCWAVFNEGHITYDGKLSACCFDTEDKWEMADLNEQSFADAWNSEKFQKLRRAHLLKAVTGTACEGCIGV